MTTVEPQAFPSWSSLETFSNLQAVLGELKPNREEQFLQVSSAPLMKAHGHMSNMQYYQKKPHKTLEVQEYVQKCL